MAKSIHASRDSVSVAAAQPIIGGSAPGMAPTTVANDVRSLSGV